MFCARLWNHVTRVTKSQCFNQVQKNTIGTAFSPLLFKFSPCLFAEPLKKKKRIDPAILKAREERKKKKIEKQIRRLEKNARQLKPIEEVEVPWILIDEKSTRMRNVTSLSQEQEEERALLVKEWSRYKYRQHLEDLQQIDKMICSQQKALDELRAESEELYLEAIQIDPTLIPIEIEGPARTPAIKNYESPDGEYTDVSKKWI
ncbi:39S ribosomal protein L40, mitochondrial [Gryllus bimaculatus]|nr:39S ribosomal protein L40, mitochondrial [Gryllus bimaculatus]